MSVRVDGRKRSGHGPWVLAGYFRDRHEDETWCARLAVERANAAKRHAVWAETRIVETAQPRKERERG